MTAAQLSPVNQKAKQALDSLQAFQDEAAPPGLYLAIWALENRTLSGRNQVYQNDLLDQAWLMAEWDQERVQELLTPLASKGDFRPGEDWLGNGSPEDLAVKQMTVLV